jgi:crotonobetainyl-CoA:carnitine CoA-transferase CaiB-like acyl-CoA transferase
MDLTVQAMSGVMSITGFPDKPPVKSGQPSPISSRACTSSAAS